MAAKNNSLFLFLALACFVGIILIFIFDGYIGVYDRLVMDNLQYKQTVEGDQWAQQEKFGGVVGTSIDRSGQVDFTYTIENHRFSPFTDSVKISLWSNKVETANLLSEQVSIPAFDKKEFKWTVSAVDILPANYSTGQSYFVSLKIKRNTIERQVNVNVYTSPDTIKMIPAPVSQ
jgi:hypothetical protein